jgi:TonB-dependent siderophore receptor
MQAGQEHSSAAKGAVISGGEGRQGGRPWKRAKMPSLVAAALVALVQPAVQAQQPPPGQAQQHQEEVAFSIAAQPLAGALRQFTQQAQHQVLFDPQIVAGRTSPALQGRFTPRQALDRLLAGTGVTVIDAVPGAYTLKAPAREPSPAADAALGTVLVTAQAQGGDTTEGSGSYAASRVSLGKGQNVRETPQSITVVTRQRIEDQGLLSVGEVMQQTTGVTVDYAGSGGLGGTANSFYARGFQISNVQIDGSAVDAFSQATFDPNMAMYDSVQVIRGADGLFSGNGEPGGSINLVRKRPTAQPQVLASASVGSWNQRRAELDVAGPLAADGRVRGRAVLAHSDREFFYDYADARNTLLYGIVEADLTPATKLTLGGSYDKSASMPWRGGLPRAANGDDLHLPRSTALMASWSHYDRTTKELFAQLEQKLEGDWRIRAHANYIKLDSDSRLTGSNGAVDPTTGLGPTLNGFSNDFYSTKKALDANVGGTFSLLGRRHRLLLGADWAQIRDTQDTYLSEVDMPGDINVFRFDPGAIPLPSLVWKTRSFAGYGATQKALYGRLNLSLTDRLTAIVGARRASYETQTPYLRFNQAGELTSRSVSGYSESGIFTPYGGLVYDIDDRWTAYGSVAEIHKSQANNLGGPLPGTPLDPIKGRNFELGAKGEFNEGRLMASMALYRIERNGEAVADPSYPNTDIGDAGLTCCWISKGKVVSQGVEGEISGELARGWQLFAGYTFNTLKFLDDTEVSSTNFGRTVTPKHILRLWSDYRLPGEWSAWTLGGGVNYQTGSYTETRSVRVSQAPYAVWNARIGYKINKNWSAALNVNNLFDKTYYQTIGAPGWGSFYGEPRNATLTVRGTF